jgi:TonB family protein
MNWIQNKIDKLILSGNLYYVILIIFINIFILILLIKSKDDSTLDLSLQGKNIVSVPVKFLRTQKQKTNSYNKNILQEQENQNIQQSFEQTGSEGLLQESYIAKVLSKIEKNKRYPKIELLMEREGYVKVQVELDSLGNIVHLNVLEGTNENFINEALRSIQVSAPFDPLPAEFKNKFIFVVNIKFILK